MSKVEFKGQNLLIGLTYLQYRQNSEIIRQNERANELREELVQNSLIQINQNAEIIQNLIGLASIADEHLELDKKIYSEQQRDKYVKNLIFEITEELKILNGANISLFEKKLVSDLILDQFANYQISHADVFEIADKEKFRDLLNELKSMNTSVYLEGGRRRTI